MPHGGVLTRSRARRHGSPHLRAIGRARFRTMSICRALGEPRSRTKYQGDPNLITNKAHLPSAPKLQHNCNGTAALLLKAERKSMI